MQQSSVDIRAFVLQDLSGARINKIYRIGETWILDVFKGERKFVKITPGGVWFSKTKPHAPEPRGFLLQVRKHLQGRHIDSVRQAGWDRVVVFKIGEYELVAEIFGKGNVLLLKDGKIIGAAHLKRWRHRDILPGKDYVPPPGGLNLLEMGYEEFAALKGRTAELLVKKLSLGNYGKKMLEGLEEEWEDVPEEKKCELFKGIRSLIDSPPQKDWEERVEEKKPENKELEALRVSLEQQKAAIEKNREKAAEAREKGKLVMKNLPRVEGLLREARGKMKTGEKMSDGVLDRKNKTLELELS